MNPRLAGELAATPIASFEQFQFTGTMPLEAYGLRLSPNRSPWSEIVSVDEAL